MSEALVPSVRRAARNPNPQSSENESAPVAGQSANGEEDRDDDGNWPFTKAELLKRVIQWRKTARDHWQEWRQEASDCYDFVAGHQWSEDDLQILRDQMRPAVTFNRIGPFVDVVGGLEINNRQETMYYPRQMGAAGVNELLTAAGKWCRDECNAEDEESEAFRDAFICGIGDTQTLMVYDDDPDGNAEIVRIDPLEVLWDPAARKNNMMDARYVMRIKDITVETAEDAFPDVETQDLHAQWAEDELDEAKNPHNARLAPYYRIDQAGEIDRQTQMCRMVEVEWWDWVPAWRVLDTVSGRFVRLSEQKARLYVVRARQLGHDPQLLRDREKKYYKAIIGARVLRVMAGPDKGGFTIKAITGRRDRNRGVWYGVVRAMRDPQTWANKFFSQMLHIINTNAKGGLIAEESAFVDPQEARDSWADADSITFLNDGAIGKVMPKNPPQFPTMIPQMMQFAVEAIPGTSGINQEMVAQADKVQPGVLEMQRKQQGMTVLADLFNSLRRYRKEQGRLLLWFIQTFISDGRLIKIGGPEEQQYVPLIHQRGLVEYDVVIDDAPTSPNMKERAWTALVQLFPVLARLNAPPQMIAEALKYAPLPLAFVNKISQMIEQQEQTAMPLRQAQQQAQVDEMKGRAARQQAGAVRDQADAHRTMVEASLLPAERQADDQHQYAAAAHDMAEANLAPTDRMLEGLDLRLRAHDQLHSHLMDHATHALAVYQAMNPPQPAQQQQGAQQ